MPRLLIVDDDPVDRELAARCLDSIADLEVLEAENGKEALEMIARRPPDVVLTDLRMPEVDGLTLVRQTRERFPLLPVVLMTAQGSEKIASKALLEGAASYVPKADLVEFLAETVQQMVGVSQARHERAEIVRYLESSESRFRLANDPALIAPLVAYLQDDLERCGFADQQVRSQIGTALHESLSNSMIHGNLEVSSDLRKDGTAPFRRLIRERRRTEPWASRRVYCSARTSTDSACYIVRDEGPGFDRSTLPDPTSPESILKAQGRGLFLMYAFMDEVVHNEAGNEVRLTKWARQGAASLPAGIRGS